MVRRIIGILLLLAGIAMLVFAFSNIGNLGYMLGPGMATAGAFITMTGYTLVK